MCPGVAPICASSSAGSCTIAGGGPAELMLGYLLARAGTQVLVDPIGGVGVNLAIQDAVAAANILAGPLLDGSLSTSHLAKVQRRRELPTKFTQQVQAIMRRQIAGNPDDSGSRTVPWPMRLLESTSLPRRMRTRFMSLGIRPEQVKTPDAWKSNSADESFSVFETDGGGI